MLFLSLCKMIAYDYTESAKTHAPWESVKRIMRKKVQ